MFIRFDVIHEQTDGQTLHDSKDRAYASHRAVKIIHFNHLLITDLAVVLLEITSSL